MNEEKKEVLEPEVLPPEEVQSRGQSKNQRWVKAFGPVLAGLLIDLVDLATPIHIGLVGGMAIGGAVAYWITSLYQLPRTQRLMWAFIAGTYCTIPFTEVLPLATLLGAYLRFRSDRPATEQPTD